MTGRSVRANTFPRIILVAMAFLAAPRTARTDMTLTPAATAAGYTLSTFATNFPNDGNAGPVGIAFPGAGVMVSDFPGHVRVFPSHADGQDAASVAAVVYPPIDATARPPQLLRRLRVVGVRGALGANGSSRHAAATR